MHKTQLIQWNKVCLVVLTTCCLLAPLIVHADELSDKQTVLKNKLDQINKQIKETQAQIKKTQEQSASLKNEISLFDKSIYSAGLQIQAKETAIEETNLQIGGLKTQISKKQDELENNKKVLSELVYELAKHEDNAFLQLGFGQDDISSYLNQAQFNQDLQHKITSVVDTIKTVKIKMEDHQQNLETQRTKLTNLKDELEENRDNLNSQKKQKQQILTQTKGLEKNYQALYQKSKQEESDILKEVQALEDQVRAKLGNKTLKPGKVFGWPMDGVVTQGYGKTGFTALGYSFHNGIDIGAPAGTPIYAAYDGTVNGSGSGKAAYGNWVTIKHSLPTKGGERGVVTLYGHMRSYKVSVGQKVKKGDLVGYEGNTGNTTRLLRGEGYGFHLHFTVFDTEGFGIAEGANTAKYGPYRVPYGYTYNPKDFL